MPAISKIRYTNVIYENGGKRYIDNIFQFEGYNGILLLENGGGKTVFVQTLLQAVLPHAKVAGRRINDTLVLNNNIAHIAVEWIINEQPRRYAVTAVSLFINNREQVASYEFVNEYAPGDKDRIEQLPFVKTQNGQKRAAGKEEIAEYYRSVAASNMVAQFFGENDTLTAYGDYIEKNFKIIPSEWAKIATINMSEGGVEEYFAKCDTTGALVDRLLIPTVEEALAGNGACDFVDLFEKQRVHFHKQLQLSARIEELNQVVSDLSFYNQQLKDYHDTAALLETQKAELKMLNNYVREQLAAKNQEKMQAAQDFRDLQQAQLENERGKAAWEVAVAAEWLAIAKAEQLAAQENFTERRRQLVKQQARENDLRYAKLRLNQSQQAEISAMTKAQLDELDRDATLDDIKEQLAENGGALRGYFVDAEHRLSGEIAQYQRQVKASAAEQQNLAAQQVKLRQSRETSQQKISVNDGQIKQIVDVLMRIERDILVGDLQATVAEQQPKWQLRLAQVAKETAAMQELLQEYQQEKVACEQNIPVLQQQIEALRLQQLDNKNKIVQGETVAGQLIAKLQQLPQFELLSADLHEFYQRESTWQKRLEEQVENLHRQKVSALTAERRACRQLDDYAGQVCFTADAALMEQLPKWQENFILLESGSMYFQQALRLAKVTAVKLRASFPYWAATLITTAPEVTKLMQFLAGKAGILTQPIIVLTEPEARAICEGQPWQSAVRQIVPAQWENIEPDKFAAWLAELQLMADKVSAEKERIEAQFQRQSQCLQELRNYYQQYTYTEYQELYAIKQEISDKIAVLTRDLANLTMEQVRLNQAIASQDQRRQSLSEDVRLLNYRLREAAQYLEYQQHQRELLTANQTLRQTITKLERQLSLSEQTLTNARALYTQLCADGALAAERLEQLRSQPFYQVAQEFAPLESPYTYAVLAEQRRNLQNELSGRQQDRGRLVEKQENARSLQQSLQQQMIELSEKAELPIQQTMEFPAGGERELTRLMQELKALKQELGQLDQVYAKNNDIYQKALGAYENQRRAYEKKYGELLLFTEVLPTVAAQLAQEGERLQAAVQAVKQTITALDANLVKLQNSENLLLQKNELLHFTADNVKAAVLPVELTTKNLSQLQFVLQEILTNASKQYQQVEVKASQNQQHKEQFIGQCQHKIFDERMKQVVLTGIRTKISYREFTDWHTTIRERIAYSIRIAEGERKEHYTHIEQIIGQVHTYVADVAEELKQISKKTRIKIAESSKDFYVIHVPEWQEADGKKIIRGYFDAITKRLKQPEFSDEFGKEKPKEIRNVLEKAMRTQQLLNQIIGENSIRVKCRKVTNNNQLSIGSYTWEESCRWSGGEKWSKNMALFLGCLNYLSERGKNVLLTKACNRVVIADNPFGQASSEHVLNPVFFIAKQLGYQFIALTAHDEGGFIRKYFPVVYSCRFAQSQDQKSQIIQAEKEIKTAFFKEDNPAAMERLTDYETIGLF